MVVAGQHARFAGYKDLAPGLDEVLQAGQHVCVMKVVQDDAGKECYEVQPVDDEGAVVLDAQGDTLYADEMELLGEVVVMEPPRQDYEHDPVVVEILRGTNDVLAAAQQLAAQHEELYYKLGGVLSKVQELRLHVEAGYDDTPKGFKSYAKERAGLEPRTSYYLMDIYRSFRRAGIGADDLSGIGWTKARVLTTIPAEDLKADKARWLLQARDSSRVELERAIHESFVTAARPERPAHKRYTFYLHGDAIAFADGVLEHARSQVDPNSKHLDSAAFEFLVAQYATLIQDTCG